MYFAGIKKIGNKTSEVSVIAQDRKNIVPRTTTRLIPFETIPLKVDVKACCAPITSPFTREISEPV
jgi:hypothetical protein